MAIASHPATYNVNVIPDAPFLVVPKVSSERRAYLPIDWMEPPIIPSDAVFVLKGATKPLFALLTSAMHMSRLKIELRPLQVRIPRTVFEEFSERAGAHLGPVGG